MAQKWSQKYISNPLTNLRATDILAIARSGTSGAGQLGELSKIDANTIYIGSNGSSSNNGATLTPVVSLAQANAIIAADLTHRWKVICFSNVLTENLVIYPNVDYFFKGTEISFSNITFPQWSTVAASSDLISSINGLVWFPQADISCGFTGAATNQRMILEINNCRESLSMITNRKITFTGFTSAVSVGDALHFRVQISNFNGNIQPGFFSNISFESSASMEFQIQQSIINNLLQTFGGNGNTTSILYSYDCNILGEYLVTTTSSSNSRNPQTTFKGGSAESVKISAQHTSDYDLTILASPEVFRNLPDTSGSTTSRWSFLPYADMNGLTNADTNQLKYVSQGSSYTDNFTNLSVGQLGRPFPYGSANVIAATSGSPLSYELIGRIEEPTNCNFQPYNSIVGTGTVWTNSSSSKTINNSAWTAAPNAYFRCNYVDFSEDDWNLDFSGGTGSGKTLEFYSCPFSTTVSNATVNIQAKSLSEAFIFNNCVGGIYPFNNNASFTVKGGNFLWNGGVAPSLSLQGKNLNGSIIAQINNASFNNSSSISIVSDSKADCTAFIENCSVAQATFDFNGSAGGLVIVRTNCLDPANVTAGPNVTIIPTGNAQCIKVNFTPTAYTPSAPPSGWQTAAEQHFEGIDNELSDIKSDVSTLQSNVSTLQSNVSTLQSDVTTINSSITTINTKLGAYSYSGTTSTFGNGDITVSRSASGSTVGVNIANASNTASSDARTAIAVAGGSGGDPYIAFGVTSGAFYSLGIDNSDSDKFKGFLNGTMTGSTFIEVTSSGEINYPLQPAFFGYLATTQTDKTGTNTSYQLGTGSTLTITFDQSSDFTTAGVFTSPITCKAQFNASARVIGCTVATSMVVTIATSNRNYGSNFNRAASTDSMMRNISVLADMDAGDTAVVTIQSGGEAADTDDIEGGSANLRTYFSGYVAA